jgi:uncharacterized protein (UPF0332 family)
MERALSEAWNRVAAECLAAAGTCLGREHWRGAVNRAYYVMFAAATCALLNCGATPRKAQGTWSHEQLPDLVRDQLRNRLPVSLASQLRHHVRMGRELREMADYVPTVTIDGETARRAFGHASAVIRALRSLT